MHVTSWPSGDSTILEPILGRLRGLIPEVKTQTHILHLGTDGQIFPHVDNLDASGSWILGVSLGSPRVLRMEKACNKNESFDVLLPSGSVYVQRSYGSIIIYRPIPNLKWFIETLFALTIDTRSLKMRYFAEKYLQEVNVLA